MREGKEGNEESGREGEEGMKGGIELNSTQFEEEVVESVNPDVCVFERFILEEKYGWRVRGKKPEAMLVVDTQDLHFLRLWRGGLVKKLLKEGEGKSEFRFGDVVDSYPPVCPQSSGAGGKQKPPPGADTLLRELGSIHRFDFFLSVLLFSFLILASHKKI